MPQRYDGFNMGFSQASPGFRNSQVMSHHPDADMSSHGYDFNRMMQQHLSDGASMGYRSNLHNIQENEQDENAENPPTPEFSPQHHSMSSAMTGSVIKRASHREGPMNSSHDRSLFHSLYGQTGAYEPLSSDLTTADMCLSMKNTTNQIHLNYSNHFFHFSIQIQVHYTYTNCSIGNPDGVVALRFELRHQINQMYGSCRIETVHKCHHKAIHDQPHLHIPKMFGQQLRKHHFYSQRKHNHAPNGYR